MSYALKTFPSIRGSQRASRVSERCAPSGAEARAAGQAARVGERPPDFRSVQFLIGIRRDLDSPVTVPKPHPAFGNAVSAFPSPPPEFQERAQGLGVEFEPGDVERLGRFLSLLLEANKTTNLTSITDPAQA